MTGFYHTDIYTAAEGDFADELTSSEPLRPTPVGVGLLAVAALVGILTFAAPASASTTGAVNSCLSDPVAASTMAAVRAPEDDAADVDGDVVLTALPNVAAWRPGIRSVTAAPVHFIDDEELLDD